MDNHAYINRRQWLVQGGSTVLGLALLGCESENETFFIGEQGRLIPWSDSPDTGAMSQVNLLDSVLKARYGNILRQVEVQLTRPCKSPKEQTKTAEQILLKKQTALGRFLK